VKRTLAALDVATANKDNAREERNRLEQVENTSMEDYKTKKRAFDLAEDD
jgi:hypothetical protein